jgi:hypothetical protein
MEFSFRIDEDMFPAEQGVKARWKEDCEAGTGMCLFHEDGYQVSASGAV